MRRDVNSLAHSYFLKSPYHGWEEPLTGPSDIVAVSVQSIPSLREMAVWAAETGIHVAAILQSGKLRAQQTAEIFADQLPEAPVPQAVSGIAPNDDIKPIAKQLQSEQGPIMPIGHLPFLERLASLLVTGDADASVVTLDAGALLALAKNENGWYVDYLMQPKLLPAP